MGWSSGSEIADKIIFTAKHHIADTNARKALYKTMIKEFENHDCDTLCECLGEDPVFDKVYEELNPPESWDL